MDEHVLKEEKNELEYIEKVKELKYIQPYLQLKTLSKLLRFSNQDDCFNI